MPSPGFACRARSFAFLRKGTNSPHLEKVGTEDFGSSAQVGSESTLVRDVGQITFLLYSVPEWLANLCGPRSRLINATPAAGISSGARGLGRLSHPKGHPVF